MGKPPSQKLSDALREAITASGLSTYALAKQSDIKFLVIQRFIGGQGDIRLTTAEKLFSFLGLDVVGSLKATLDKLPQKNADALRVAIAASGLSTWALAKAANVDGHAITRFINHESDLYFTTAEKLFSFFEFKVIRVHKDRHPDPKPHIIVNDPQPLADALRVAIAASGLSTWALAKAANVDGHAITRFINHESDLKLATAEKIAFIVGVKIADDSQSAPPEADESSQPISQAIRSKIHHSGLSGHALARMAGLTPHLIRKFVRKECDISIRTSHKIIEFFGIKLVCEPTTWRPEPKHPTINPLQPLLEELRSTIVTSGLSINALAKRSGVPIASISRFLNGQRSLKYISVVKLADAVGLKLEPAKILARSGTPPPSDAGPTSVQRDSATGEDKLIDQATSTMPFKNSPTPWSGTAEDLEREIAAIKSKAAGKVVRKLIDLMPDRPTRERLLRVTDVGDAVNHLKRLAASGSPLGMALLFPGRGRLGYGIDVHLLDQ